MVIAAGDPGPARVRPHVARAVGRARHVLLDFDGVMFNVRDALGPNAREQGVNELLAHRTYRPRPVLITLVGVLYETLAFLAEKEPDNAVEAEAIVSGLELDAALSARPTPGLRELLATCAATGRKVAVISDLSEVVVLAVLRAHGLDRHIAAVAARQGLDVSAYNAAHTAERAADMLDVTVTTCLLVSGSSQAMMAAHRIGAVGLGCECGRDQRKHLAWAGAPVVSGLAPLTRALLM